MVVDSWGVGDVQFFAEPDDAQGMEALEMVDCGEHCER